MKIDLRKYNCIDALNCGLELCKEIKSYGHEAYVVGGCVRDLVRAELGQTSWPSGLAKTREAIHDIDIATNMPIEALEKVFRTESNNGEAHGTVLVFYGMGDPFEVTQFRTDGEYSDGRHPDEVSFTRSFEEDVKRRDFTMNALGMDGDGNIVDFVGGVEDIKNRVIRTVGAPADRFKEDALRIVRGVRFAVNFDYTIDISTKFAMTMNADRLENVSVERFRKEITSLRKNDFGFALFVSMLRRLSLYDHIPTFKHICMGEVLDVVYNMGTMTTLQLFTLMLFNNRNGEEAKRELCSTREEKHLYTYLVKFIRKARAECGTRLETSWTDLVELVKGDYKLFNAVAVEWDIPYRWKTMMPVAIRLAKSFPVDQSKISAEVKALGIEPGPEFGKAVRDRVEAYYKTMAGLIL